MPRWIELCIFRIKTEAVINLIWIFPSSDIACNSTPGTRNHIVGFAFDADGVAQKPSGIVGRNSVAAAARLTACQQNNRPTPRDMISVRFKRCQTLQSVHFL